MRRFFQNYPAMAAALVVITAAAFWPVVTHDFLRYDDSTYVTYNPHVANGLSGSNVLWAFRSGYASNWHPLTWISHMVDVELFGLRPGWHHLVNLLFHVANALLLFGFLRQATHSTSGSWPVAALFAVHPLHVESVAWIAERKDVLSTFFFLLTLLYYVRATRCSDGVGSSEVKQPKPTWFWLAVLWFALGLMSKPMLVTLPFVLLLLDFWPLRRLDFEKPRQLRILCRVIAEKWPFFAFSILASVVTFAVQEKAQAVVAGLSLADRVSNALVSYMAYVMKFLWPTGLAIFYPHRKFIYSEGIPLVLILSAAVGLVFLTAVALRYWRGAPWAAMGWLWFVGTLVPVIGLVQAGGQAMADRYTYIPSIGFFIVAVWTGREVVTFRRKVPELGAGGDVSAKRPYLLAVIVSTTLLTCVAVSFRQVGFWKNNLTVFERALAVTQRNSVAHSQVGMELAERGRFSEAERHFRAALAIDPSSAEAGLGLGIACEGLAQPESALQAYQAALRLKPYYWLARIRYADLLWSLDRRDAAYAEYREALKVRPNDIHALLRCGAHLEGMADPTNALLLFQQVLRLDPANVEAFSRAGQCWYALRRFPEAIREFEAALRLQPNHRIALIGLARALGNNGDYEQSAARFEQALRLSAEDPQTWLQLGMVRLRQGRVPQAVEIFRKGMRHDENYAPLLSKLAWVLATSPEAEIRNPEEAARLAQKAAQLSSPAEFPGALAALDAAYAAAGDFERALEAAKQTRDAALAAPDSNTAGAAEARMQLYRERKAFVELPAPGPSKTSER